MEKHVFKEISAPVLLLKLRLISDLQIPIIFL